MSTGLPEVKHIYQNHHLDSTLWNQFTPRDDDIVIATPIKSGTTWMQTIVMNLIFQDLQIRNLGDYSRWLDYSPHRGNLEAIQSQTHRRFIKTHLPLDGLRFFEQIRYIVVGRDARDVFMSLWNHYHHYTPQYYDDLNGDGLMGDPLPQCPDDIREFWRQWTTQGWFEWENEGYPHWSNFHHVQTWWDFKHLPNILFVHYNDLLADLEGEIQRIANYLDIDVSDDLLPQLVNTVTFKTMKENATQMVGKKSAFKGGATTFINKGTNGRWREVLTEDDLKLYDDAVKRNLTPDCVQWLENGRLKT